MYKKPTFWIIFTLITIICTIFVFKFFPYAFPMLDLEITMDREAALEKARELDEQYHLSPDGYREAAFFGSDGMTMVYVQLEAGGLDSMHAMLQGDLYSAYFWNVRHFKENEIKEVSYFFTPVGKLNGFRMKLPDDEPGAAITSDSARVLAEASAVNWGVMLDDWALVESSQEVKPGERVDHSFTYERPSVKVGDAPYRLDLTVSGDMLSEVDFDVKVPEAFRLRYQEMRSANETIASVASGAMILLYFIGGIGIGLFFIIRNRYLLWKKPLLWAGFITIMSILAQLNYLPLSWSFYDTATSTGGFISEQIVQTILGALLMGVILWLTFMAAESMTRKAFPNHPQMWRLWSKDDGATKEVFGRTLGGYWLVGIKLSFILLFYFFTQEVLGWWSPVGADVDPNILATLFPWVSSIGMSLQAGFWEECLFRAVPIAGAALIGQKYGKRNLFIIIALVVQALIFGAGHANYAQQPSYARVVELFLPSLVYGWIFIEFGLLAGIVLHYAYDAILMSLPLFIQSGEGIWFDRTMVILLTAVPLFVVLGRRLLAGRWTTLLSEHYNSGWIPAVSKIKEAVIHKTQVTYSFNRKIGTLIILLGIIGIDLFFVLHKWDNYASMLNLKQNEAIQIAEKELASQGVTLGEDWKRLVVAHSGNYNARRFIWQEGLRGQFISLLKKEYLSSPSWRVRFARFDDSVSVDERAEEYIFNVGQDKIISFEHKLPEAWDGDSLSVTDARELAHTVLRDKYSRDPFEFKETLAKENKKPNRKDWKFEFSDTLNYPLENGEARIAVDIGGNKVTSYQKKIEIAEEWERERRDKRKIANLINSVKNNVKLLLQIAAVIMAVVAWSRRKFPVKIFLVFLGIIGVTKLVAFFNEYPNELAFFSTAESLNLQFMQRFFIGVMRDVVSAAGLALMTGLAHRWITDRTEQDKAVSTKGIFLVTLAAGAVIGGFQAIMSALYPQTSPVWIMGGLYQSSFYVPILGSLSFFEYFLSGSIFTLLTLAALHLVTDGWRTRKLLAGAGLIVIHLMLTGFSSDAGYGLWLAEGIVMGLVYLALYISVFRYKMTLIPLAFLIPKVLSNISSTIIYPHPVTIQINVVTVILVILMVVYWTKMLDSDK